MVLFKRSAFWLSLTLVSCGATFFSYQYLDKVYSLVNISITADRHQVLADAQELASQLSWDIAGYQDVTSFESQDDLQCFVELQAGGKDAFVQMFQSGVYHPYHWHVRFFKEKQVVEMHAWFSPQGTRLGFLKKLSQKAPGAALNQDQAQALITSVIDTWCPHFDQYKLIEYDSEIQDTGRVDHDFTYERTDMTIGAGLYRFKAVVCGDVITRLQPLVKIPDNFLRHYKEMRSANNLLAAVGVFFFKLLYLLFFGVLGLVFFYRRNYLLSKNSAKIAGIVAGGAFFKGLNELPLSWSSYDTVQASSTFILMKLFEQLINFLILFGMIFLTVVVAEAAGRWIYKHHIQFFQIFTMPGLSSLQVGQQVVFGYLMVPFMFGYVVLFGYITKDYFSWWSPAGSLFDPNVVACYFPWLSAITISLQAGFFEEVVCRALPLAMTAVLTRTSKHKNFWFIGIFLLQALIFGASHANYPNQPFYARLIELIIPSFGFGWMYLTFGLLPGVITHFVYDVVWFAMPIFASNLLWSKITVILLAGLPLLVVSFLFLYRKKWHELPISFFNQSFPEPDSMPSIVVARKIGTPIPARYAQIILIAGLFGIFAWAVTYRYKADVAPLWITKTQAIERARQEIEMTCHTQLDASWTPITVVQDECSSLATRFIWQVYGQDIYNLAQGSYLTGISWQVRFVQFSGTVQDRGQEYAVVVTTDHQEHPHVVSFEHKIPEHFVGADISQEQALAIVYDFVAQKYLLNQQDLTLISTNSDKFEHRRDWEIILQDTEIFDFALQGQARIKVKLCGDQVSQYSRFIFVPEDWKRADQALTINLNLVKTGLWFILLFFIILALACGVPYLTRSQYGLQMIRHKAALITIILSMYVINNIPLLIGKFNTAEPFYDQLTRLSLSLIVAITYQMLLCSIFLAIGAVSFIKGKKCNDWYGVLLSIAAGCMVIGTNSVLNFFQPSLQPVVQNYSALATYIPLLACVTHYIKLLYGMLTAVVTMFIVTLSVRHLWPHRLWIQCVGIVLFCMALQIMQPNMTITWMLLHGFVMGCVVSSIFYLLLVYDMTLISFVVATVIAGMIISQIVTPFYVGASLHGIIAMMGIVGVAYYFYKKSHQE